MNIYRHRIITYVNLFKMEADRVNRFIFWRGSMHSKHGDPVNGDPNNPFVIYDNRLSSIFIKDAQIYPPVNMYIHMHIDRLCVHAYDEMYTDESEGKRFIGGWLGWSLFKLSVEKMSYFTYKNGCLSLYSSAPKELSRVVNSILYKGRVEKHHPSVVYIHFSTL